MEIAVAQQTRSFLVSLLLGGLLAALYDVFRILRRALPSPPALVAVQDVLYLALSGVVVFNFLVTHNAGQIRIFLLAGTAFGAVIYACTLGRLVMAAAEKIIAFFRWLLDLLLRPFRAAGRLLGPAFDKLRLFGGKAARKAKYRLNLRIRLLYNKHKPERKDVRRRGKASGRKKAKKP